MTSPELIRWANAPEQKENVVAEAVRLLANEWTQAMLECGGLKLKIADLKAAIRNYEAECARLRKTALPQAPWESEEVPM